jgi:hypothetical protein
MSTGFWFSFFLGALCMLVVSSLIGLAVFYAARHPRRTVI